MSGIPAHLEVMMERHKLLRQLYEMVALLAPSMNFDYEGDIICMGSQVTVKDRAGTVLFMMVDQSIPLTMSQENITRNLLNSIDWMTTEHLVMQIVGNDLVFGVM